MTLIGEGRLGIGPNNSTDTKASQRDLAYGVIRRSILLGHAKRGSRINERVLAEKLGISRVPVREAMLCLHGEGLISKSKRGLEVTQLSPEEIMYQVEFRAIVECAAIRLVAERITPAELQRLREVVAQQEILIRAQDREAFRESDLSFHQLLLKATRNPFIIRLSGTLALGSMIENEREGEEGETRLRLADAVAVEGHRRILNAVARKRADEAEALMYEHIAKGMLYESQAEEDGDEDKA